MECPSCGRFVIPQIRHRCPEGFYDTVPIRRAHLATAGAIDSADRAENAAIAAYRKMRAAWGECWGLR